MITRKCVCDLKGVCGLEKKREDNSPRHEEYQNPNRKGQLMTIQSAMLTQLT